MNNTPTSTDVLLAAVGQNRVQFFLLVAVLALTICITRFLPFLLFRKQEKTPRFIAYLGRVLPAAMMGFLVVYCFRNVAFTDYREVVPAAVACAGVVGMHLWKRNTIVSIVTGTALYMILIRLL